MRLQQGPVDSFSRRFLHSVVEQWLLGQASKETQLYRSCLVSESPQVRGRLSLQAPGQPGASTRTGGAQANTGSGGEERARPPVGVPGSVGIARVPPAQVSSVQSVPDLPAAAVRDERDGDRWLWRGPSGHHPRAPCRPF